MLKNLQQKQCHFLQGEYNFDGRQTLLSVTSLTLSAPSLCPSDFFPAKRTVAEYVCFASDLFVAQ